MERPNLPWLATEQEKVARFAELGIKPATLPQRVYGGAARRSRCYFHQKLPVAVGARRAVFVYVDPGGDAMGLTETLRQAQGLYERIRASADRAEAAGEEMAKGDRAWWCSFAFFVDRACGTRFA